MEWDQKGFNRRCIWCWKQEHWTDENSPNLRLFEEIIETKGRSDRFQRIRGFETKWTNKHSLSPGWKTEHNERSKENEKETEVFTKIRKKWKGGTELGPEVEKQGSTREQTTWPPLPRQRADKEKNERPRAKKQKKYKDNKKNEGSRANLKTKSNYKTKTTRRMKGLAQNPIWKSLSLQLLYF